jgi:hypothetical protein
MGYHSASRAPWCGSVASGARTVRCAKWPLAGQTEKYPALGIAVTEREPDVQARRPTTWFQIESRGAHASGSCRGRGRAGRSRVFRVLVIRFVRGYSRSIRLHRFRPDIASRLCEVGPEGLVVAAADRRHDPARMHPAQSRSADDKVVAGLVRSRHRSLHRTGHPAVHIAHDHRPLGAYRRHRPRLHGSAFARPRDMHADRRTNHT